jgi:hypothetical protein
VLVHPAGVDLSTSALRFLALNWRHVDADKARPATHFPQVGGELAQRPASIGCETLGGLRARRGVTFRRTKTWKESRTSSARRNRTASRRC